MSSSCGSVASPSSSTTSEDETRNPLWRFVRIIAKAPKGQSGYTWECKFCNTTRTTTATRMRSHLLKEKKGSIAICTGVSPESIAEMKKALDDHQKKILASAPKQVPLPPPTKAKNATTRFSSDFYGGGELKKRKGGESGSTIKTAFNMQERDTLHALIARLFYSSGIPFNVARNPYFVAAFMYAANHNLTGYRPPNYNMLRDTLLDQEKANISRLLQPIKSTWREKGVSIVSDGWSDSQRRPLINFMAVTESGPMFLKAVDCSGEIKDKWFIFGLMKEVIEEVGPQNVVQVITDNARNCQAAGLLVETSYPNIVWTPCVVHTLNLALQNICAAQNCESNEEVYGLCAWITEIVADGNAIKNFIMNHQMMLAMYNKYVPLKLLSVATTRFASMIVMLKRLKLIKASLGRLVTSDEWSLYRDDDKDKANFVKNKVTNDEWWDKVDYILEFTDPIYHMLRLCDTDRPCLHLVYDMWDTMIEKVKHAICKYEKIQPHEESPFYKVIHEILVSRWNKSNTPLHCLAHSLNPKYYSEEWLKEDLSRSPPHMDNEVAQERIKCFKKYFPDALERKAVTMEFANFSSKSSQFSDSDSIEQRYDMDPKSWWVTYGTSAPKLQTLALKLLAQPASSSCAERNWSTYSFINSLKRNKLTPARADDLVNIHSNLRLLSRKTHEYTMGDTKGWDIGGDNFGSLLDIGDLEFADLTLDDPEREMLLLEDRTNVPTQGDDVDVMILDD